MLQAPLEEPADPGPELLRRKRATQAEKNTCQLYIQTDHLFFRYYGTREAVIAQVSWVGCSCRRRGSWRGLGVLCLQPR